MKIPIDHFNFGSRRWDIEVKPGLEDAAFGLSRYTTCKIEISDKISEADTKRTLLHEIIHQILCDMGRGDWADENLIGNLEYGLSRAMRENSKLFAWIMK